MGNVEEHRARFFVRQVHKRPTLACWDACVVYEGPKVLAGVREATSGGVKRRQVPTAFVGGSRCRQSGGEGLSEGWRGDL